MAKTDREIVNTKADYRKDIRLMIQPLKAAMNKVIVKDEETGELTVAIDMKTARDVNYIVTSLEKCIKTDLLLMGEADSRTDMKIEVDLPDEWSLDL